MKTAKVILTIALVIFVIVGCNTSNHKYSDTPTTGHIKIGCDETLKPICDAEIQVFESLYSSAGITPAYYTEKDLFKYLLSDSIRLILTSRKLTSQEEEFFKAKKFYPRQTKIAIDALALLIHPENTDSLISIRTLKDILTGKTKQWDQINPRSKLGNIQVVFDNQNSSTVRYLVDSITKGETLSSSLSAVDVNQEVIEYVSRNKNAMGIIGVSWVSNKADSSSLSFLKKIRVMAVSDQEIATYENSYQPFQAYISQGAYPLTRFIYVVNSEPRQGLASGFVAFLASDRGQRIILRNGILPATQPIRIINVKNDF
jgi:phosphate transport system substrate-binding protein